MSNNSNKKDKNIAAILAFFLGHFGVHHFYLGNTGLGILHLVTFFISFIPSWIDGVTLLTRSQDDFDRRYNPKLFERNEEGRSWPAIINVADEILKLDTLFKNGVITFEEFEKRKAILLR